MWESYDLKHFKLESGTFNQDSKGRWYANIMAEPHELCGPVKPKSNCDSVGIDLGLKDFLISYLPQTLQETHFVRMENQQLTCDDLAAFHGI